MKFVIKESQLEKMSLLVSKFLDSRFKDDDEICGFDVFVDSEEPTILVVYIILNKNKVMNNNYIENTLFKNRWRNAVKESINKYFPPFDFDVNTFAKNCEE